MNQLNYLKCDNCIYKNCPQIPPTPIEKNNLMIVGEGPGKTELIKKVPFVGKSGQLLKQALVQVGLPSNPFITNALLCMPNKSKSNVISKEAIINCRDRLFYEIEQVKPKMIIALGNVALHALTDDFSLKISTMHSKALKFKDGIWLIPIFHPAAILRNMKNIRAFKDGFEYANEIFNNNTIKKPEPTNYLVVDSEEMAKKAVKFLLTRQGIIASDIETGGLDPFKSPILCIGFAYDKGKVIIFPDKYLKYIKPLFDSHLKFTWQRGQFDTLFLRIKELGNANINHDTMLLHYCLDESEGGHDLKALAIRYLGAEDYEKEVKKYKKQDKGYQNCPRDKLYRYLAFDCDYTRQLYNIFLPKVKADPDLDWLYHHILITGINFLRRVTQNGFFVDVPYVMKYKKKLEKEIKALKQEILKQIGHFWNKDLYIKQTGAKSASEELNLQSTYQMRWILYDVIGIRPTVKTKTKKCIDENVLKNVDYAHPFIPTYIKLKKKQKILSTYVNGVLKRLGPDNRLRSDFSLQTAVTGRLSSKKPNLQNIKRDSGVKNIFSAPPGKILIEADYKGAELRVLAHVSKDEFLIKLFKEGRDPHDEMSRKIFGDNFTKEQRVKVKGLNFGATYGRGETSIAEEFNMSIREARILLREWFATMPQAKQWLDNCEKRFLNGEVFTTPFGRKRRWGIKINDKHLLNESRNFEIQSVASDLTFVSAMLLEKRLKNLDCSIVNLVHDSIIIEAPNDKDTFWQIIDIIKNTMENVPRETIQAEVPFPVEIKMGKSWGNLFEIDITKKEIITKAP